MTRDLNVVLPDAVATLALGARLARGIAPGSVLFLRGGLGAGKTTLVRGMLRALGVREHIKSPTYALVELYELSSLNLYHFDFFRLKDHSEWIDSGFREYFNPTTVCVVEWPERAGPLLAVPDLDAHLGVCDVGRTARLTAPTARGRDWLAACESP